jgi:hypothetical protein
MGDALTVRLSGRHDKASSRTAKKSDPKFLEHQRVFRPWPTAEGECISSRHLQGGIQGLLGLESLLCYSFTGQGFTVGKHQTIGICRVTYRLNEAEAYRTLILHTVGFTLDARSRSQIIAVTRRQHVD